MIERLNSFVLCRNSPPCCPHDWKLTILFVGGGISTEYWNPYCRWLHRGAFVRRPWRRLLVTSSRSITLAWLLILPPTSASLRRWRLSPPSASATRSLASPRCVGYCLLRIMDVSCDALSASWKAHQRDIWCGRLWNWTYPWTNLAVFVEAILCICSQFAAAARLQYLGWQYDVNSEHIYHRHGRMSPHKCHSFLASAPRRCTNSFKRGFQTCIFSSLHEHVS